MSNNTKFYIDGAWVEPAEKHLIDVEDPSTEAVFTQISAGTAADVDRAVAAAKRAFPAFSATKVADRRELLANISREYVKRYKDIADAVSLEMGAPLAFRAWRPGLDRRRASRRDGAAARRVSLRVDAWDHAHR